MNLKSSLVVCGLILLVALMVGAQSNQKPSASERYKLVPAQILMEVEGGSQVPSPAVFLLDSESGQVWRMQAAFTKLQDGKRIVVGEQFFEIKR